MTALRHLLLACLLFAAQLVAGVHAVEHTLGEADGLPPHTCPLCLEAHDLGAALPALPPVLFSPPTVGEVVVHAPVLAGVVDLPLPRQGAPPFA